MPIGVYAQIGCCFHYGGVAGCSSPPEEKRKLLILFKIKALWPFYFALGDI